MHKKIVTVLSTFVLCILAGGPVLAGSSWDGFYFGLGYGGAILTPDMKTSTVYSPSGFYSSADIQAINNSGDLKLQNAAFDYSAHLGYNFSLDSGIVAGLQADFGSMGVNLGGGNLGSYASNPANHFSVSQGAQSSWTGMVRPRLGLDLDGTLLYATGGLSFTNLSFLSIFGDSVGGFDVGGNSYVNVSPYSPSILTGLVLGAGAEIKLSPEYSITGEYLYINYGTVNFTNSNLTVGGVAYPSNVITDSINLVSSSFQLSVNYHL